MAKQQKLKLDGVRLRLPTIKLSEKISLAPKLSKKHNEALRGRMQQPDKPA